jgi:hypothetical protein
MSLRLTQGDENIRAAHVGQVVNLRPLVIGLHEWVLIYGTDGKVFSTVPA